MTIARARLLLTPPKVSDGSAHFGLIWSSVVRPSTGFGGEWRVARILISGGRGLIGDALAVALRGAGHEVRGIDRRADRQADDHGDIRDADLVAPRIAGCDGIVHLAAVSRVVWAQREPALCWEINVSATQRLLAAARASAGRPWVLFASSREVYGEPEQLPVDEDSPLCPINIYGRSKAEGERLMRAAREAGLNTAVVRLSNVYGSIRDYPDRVVPAFARGAALGGTLRVCGNDTLLDFIHLDDVVHGIMTMIEQLNAGQRLLPVNLTTGKGTTLGELALLAKAARGSRAKIIQAPAQAYEITRFVGAPDRAMALLGWCAQVAIASGIARLVQDCASAAGFVDPSAAAPKSSSVA